MLAMYVMFVLLLNIIESIFKRLKKAKSRVKYITRLKILPLYNYQIDLIHTKLALSGL